jgi:hypothetical protein
MPDGFVEPDHFGEPHPYFAAGSIRTCGYARARRENPCNRLEPAERRSTFTGMPEGIAHHVQRAGQVEERRSFLSRDLVVEQLGKLVGVRGASDPSEERHGQHLSQRLVVEGERPAEAQRDGGHEQFVARRAADPEVGGHRKHGEELGEAQPAGLIAPGAGHGLDVTEMGASPDARVPGLNLPFSQ